MNSSRCGLTSNRVGDAMLSLELYRICASQVIATWLVSDFMEIT